MARFIKDRSASAGTAPGSLVFIGNKKMQDIVIQLIEYDENELTESSHTEIEEVFPSFKNSKASWINIYGIHDPVILEKLGKELGLSSLFMEDILNTDQQPCFIDGEGYDGFILKILRREPGSKVIHAEQVTLILGENYVLTLQEQTARYFESVRNRIRSNQRKVRLLDNDYLLYALLDTLVDDYISIIEGLGREVEDMSIRLFEERTPGIDREIFDYKMEMNYIRKQVRPMREIMLQVLQSDDSNFKEKNVGYLRDLNDLVVQATEAIELYSNMISDHLNIYNTQVSNRMNEVMKVLTIFASIFIPLTFVAGIYGMNFENIPELRLQYGYFYFWGLILIVALLLVYYFKKKKWL